MPDVDRNPSQLSGAARQAARARDWATVSACAAEILKQDKNSAEAHFLAGLALKATGRADRAIEAFSRAIKLGDERYDAAIELASLYAALLRHRDALELLRHYESRLGNSPLYLNMAGETYSRLALHADAWPLYRKASELQPEIELFQANLAASSVYVGRIDEAKTIYRSLLAKNPDHQRNHYELSRLERAQDSAHVEQMQEILEQSKRPPGGNVFLYYAIAKELEDLERWDGAFEYYKKAGDAAKAVADYDVGTDIELIDTVIRVCDAEWLAACRATEDSAGTRSTPIFIVGLPRTGTTLTERIVSRHSHVETADESFFMRNAIWRVSGLKSRDDMSPAIVAAAAEKDIGLIAEAYLDAIDYRLTGRPMFVDKLPENVLHLGFIAKAFPHARLVLLRRNPMDACFAMYKQSFFRFAYTLGDLGRYYVAYDRLRSHWREVLGDRLIEVEYEALVTDQEAQMRRLLDRLGLDFEPACLDFDANQAPSATASSAQVRERIHRRSVNKWKHFAEQLKPLKTHLEESGISLE